MLNFAKLTGSGPASFTCAGRPGQELHRFILLMFSSGPFPITGRNTESLLSAINERSVRLINSGYVCPPRGRPSGFEAQGFYIQVQAQQQFRLS